MPRTAFFLTILSEIYGYYHEFIIWCTNECLFFLRHNGPIFIDCTFRSVPSPFVQCFIVTVFDVGTELYITCAYCLMKGKNEYLYCNVLHKIVALLEYSWMPNIITSDFELWLISAMRHEFPESHLHGFYFHLNQAIYSIIRKYQLLTVVPISNIPQAILFIKSKFTDNES
ncbi:LOW QUALITY PROTEIN: hypothetical protein HZS_3693 [Henneguya salminicola]|nr:LOW QUALITY PROTEIN: hypothetical protein HZS_3693 [Henneguya salminicola]